MNRVMLGSRNPVVKQWVDLRPLWSIAEEIGGQRQRQKDGWCPDRLYRKDKRGHIIGFAGEMVASMTLGIPLDATQLLLGDSGWDLEDGTDVKTTGYDPPILKHEVDAKFWAEKYALVYLDESWRAGYLVGVVPGDLLRYGGVLRRFGPNLPWNHTLDEEVVRRNRIDQ
jgi:hypothetical protein